MEEGDRPSRNIAEPPKLPSWAGDVGGISHTELSGSGSKSFAQPHSPALLDGLLGQQYYEKSIPTTPYREYETIVNDEPEVQEVGSSEVFDQSMLESTVIKVVVCYD